MSRFSSLVAEIQAAYPTAGNTTWLVGAKHLGEHRNWNRIVAYMTTGSVGIPSQAAGFKGDDWRWTRKVGAVFSIWASSQKQAEDRLHALLCAIYDVMGATVDSVSDLKETWYPEGIAGAGCVVDLSCMLDLVVLASDVNVVEADAEPGEGFATLAAESITIHSQLEDTSLPDVVIEEP